MIPRLVPALAAAGPDGAGARLHADLPGVLAATGQPAAADGTGWAVYDVPGPEGVSAAIRRGGVGGGVDLLSDLPSEAGRKRR
ncbi:hypothetical protein ABIA38_009066 [Embleya sp. AB8]